MGCVVGGKDERRQTEEPIADVYPVAQDRQAEYPVSGEKALAAQGRATLAPSRPTYMPAEEGVHVVEPKFAANVPTGHCANPLEPAAAPVFE